MQFRSLPFWGKRCKLCYFLFFRTGLQVTHGDLARYLVPAGTALVTNDFRLTQTSLV